MHGTAALGGRHGRDERSRRARREDAGTAGVAVARMLGVALEVVVESRAQREDACVSQNEGGHEGPEAR